MDIVNSSGDTGASSEGPLLDVFPEPLEVSEDISRLRRRRTTRLFKVAWLGISVRLFVIVMELVGLWFLGHSVLLVDALASSADVLTSLAILFAIRLAEQPPDDDHPFGHGRYEPLAGFQLGILILIVGAATFGYQLFAAISHAHSEVIGWVSWTIPLFAALLLEVTCRVVFRMAQQEKSCFRTAGCQPDSRVWPSDRSYHGDDSLCDHGLSGLGGSPGKPARTDR